MKIYPINRYRIKRAIIKTSRVGEAAIQKTAQPLQVLKQNGKGIFIAALFSSMTYHTLVSRFLTRDTNVAKQTADIFETSIKKQLPERIRIKPQAKPRTKVHLTASNTTLNTVPMIDRPIEELNDSLNALLLKRKNQINPIINKTSVFIEKGNKYNVNPLVLMGIAMLESARGSSVAAVKKNNIGGIMGKKGLRTFENVDDCIDIMAATIAKHSKNHNLKTVNDLAYSGKYCDKKVAKEWAKNVMYYVNKLS